MHSSALRAQLENAIRSRCATPLAFKEKSARVLLPSGVPGIDIPRGTLTEIYGASSSGKTSLSFAVLAHVTRQPECCVLIDGSDAFDPVTGAEAGIDLHQLLWIRCGGNAEHALKATDLVVQAGGFGMVVLDLEGISRRQARRISLASWFRLRHAVERTHTALVVIEQELNAASCSTSQMEIRQTALTVEGALVRGLEAEAHMGPRLRTRSPLELHAVFTM